MKRVGDVDGACAEYDNVIEGLTPTLGAAHPDTLGTRINLAALLEERRDTAPRESRLDLCGEKRSDARGST